MSLNVASALRDFFASAARQIKKEPLGLVAAIVSVLGLAWPAYVAINRQCDITTLLHLVDLEADIAKTHDVGRLDDLFAPDATVIKWEPPSGATEAALKEERWIGLDQIRERYKTLPPFPVLTHTHVRINGYWPWATTAWATSSTVGLMSWDNQMIRISRPDADRWEFRKARIGWWPFREWRVENFEYHYSSRH
jgi:hypothetical protein